MALTGVSGGASMFSNIYKTRRAELQKSMKRLSSNNRLVNIGDAPSDTAICDGLEYSLRKEQAILSNIQSNTTYFEVTDVQLQNISQMLIQMSEKAAQATQPFPTPSDRVALHSDFDLLKQQATNLCRQANFEERQNISREGIISFDSNELAFKSWSVVDTNNPQESFQVNFAALSTDANGQLFSFSGANDFKMDRTGQNLYYVDTSNKLCSYNISLNQLTRSASALSAGTRVFIDEVGGVYAGELTGAMYSVNTGTLATTALAAAGTAKSSFSVYNGNLYYSDSGTGDITSYNLTTAVSTTQMPNASLPAGLFAVTDNTFSSCGRYIASTTGTNSVAFVNYLDQVNSTITLPVGVTVDRLQFSEDGDRLYYHDSTTKNIGYVNIDPRGNVGTNQSLITNQQNLQGLCVTGSYPGSLQNLATTAQGVPGEQFVGVDVRPYLLGIANLRIDTVTNATNAITALQTAQDRVSMEITRTGAMLAHLSRREEQSQRQSALLTEEYESIHDVDEAAETALFTRLTMEQEVTMAMLAQMNNINYKMVSTLLQGAM